MQAKQLFKFALGSLLCYGIVNWLMSNGQLHLQPKSVTSQQMWQGLIAAIILYAVGLIIWRLHRLAGFYVFGIILIVYSLGLISALLSSFQSSAPIIMKSLVEGIAVAGLLVNGYLAVLLTRARQNKK